MRQVIYTFCAGLLAVMAYAAMPGTASAEPAMPAAQTSTDTLLQKTQYGGGGGYRDDGYNREYRDRDDDPPPPPRQRPHYRMDPGWSNDGAPRFRSDRFTGPYCEDCAYICNGERQCPPRCWGWRRYCDR